MIGAPQRRRNPEPELDAVAECHHSQYLGLREQLVDRVYLAEPGEILAAGSTAVVPGLSVGRRQWPRALIPRSTPHPIKGVHCTLAGDFPPPSRRALDHGRI